MKKKLITVAVILITLSSYSQEKISAFAELTSYNLTEYVYTLDVNYNLTDNLSISSWNTITSGRNEAQGYNYSVMSLMFNLSDKNNKSTFSVGYGEINQISYNFNNKAIIVKLRVKLL
jgi:hypothetical protein